MSPLKQVQAEKLTVVDHQIGLPTFAINLIARPDGAVHQMMAQLQEVLAANLPAGVFTCPLDSLHLTVVPIIWARGTYDIDVQEWWSKNAAAVQADLIQTTVEARAMTLKCAGVDVLPGAIVIRFDPNDALNAFRESIHNTQSVMDVLVEKVDFTHVTVFRFEQELSLSHLTEIVKGHAIPKVAWAIDHLTLCQENIYPSLAYQDIARLELVS